MTAAGTTAATAAHADAAAVRVIPLRVTGGIFVNY